MTEDTTGAGERWSKRQYHRQTPTGKTDGKKFKTCCLLCNKNPRKSVSLSFHYDKTTSSLATHDIPDWGMRSRSCRLQYGCWQQLSGFYTCLRDCLSTGLLQTFGKIKTVVLLYHPLAVWVTVYTASLLRYNMFIFTMAFLLVSLPLFYSTLILVTGSE